MKSAHILDISKSIIIATNNAHKVEEIRGILPYYNFCSLKDIGLDIEVVEDGSTFEANATKKAMGVAEAAHDAGIAYFYVLADDSGLVVDSLGGAPGIYSSRYAGESATDTDNNTKLLRVLGNSDDRAAHFACCVVLVEGGESRKVVFSGTGKCPGTIRREADGAGGFGYDPLFVPDGHNDTFGMLGEDVKNKISHRAHALALLKKFLESHK